LELVDGVYPEFDVETYRAGHVAPVFFGSALNNFGVQELLNCFVQIAPSPKPTMAEEREVQPTESKFTGFIFKITANIDPNHRSCIAFCKICSGKFVRNQPYRHVRLDKTLRFSSPTQFMAQRKSTIDEAYAEFRRPGVPSALELLALKLSRSLQNASALVKKGEISLNIIREKMLAALEPLKVDYIAFVDHKFNEISQIKPADSIILLAAKVGKTRLIDNIWL